MTVVVDVAVEVRRREDQNEHYDHEASAIDLALEDRTQQIKAIPIDYYIANDDSNDAKEGSGCPHTDCRVLLDDHTKQIACYS